MMFVSYDNASSVPSFKSGVNKNIAIDETFGKPQHSDSFIGSVYCK
jgi:hypothetical protein